MFDDDDENREEVDQSTDDEEEGDLDRLSDMEDDDEESQEATSSEAKDSDEEEDADSDESRDSEEDSLTVPSGKRRKTSETSESRADRVEDDSEEEDNGSLFSGSTGTFPKDKATAATPPTPRIVLKSTDAIMACALPYAFTSSSSDCQSFALCLKVAPTTDAFHDFKVKIGDTDETTVRATWCLLPEQGTKEKPPETYCFTWFLHSNDEPIGDDTLFQKNAFLLVRNPTLQAGKDYDDDGGVFGKGSCTEFAKALTSKDYYKHVAKDRFDHFVWASVHDGLELPTCVRGKS